MSRESEFSDYVVARWPRLVRSAILMGCAPAEAEDIVQSALERCLINWRRVERADNRDAYVYRVLVNTFTSARRRRWRDERPTSELPEHGEDGEFHRVDDTDAVARALDRLPREQRLVVVLRYYDHLSESHIAAALGIATGTVKSRMSRALKALAADPSLRDELTHA